MGKVNQYKRGLSAFISSEQGQRFFNFAYSIGAAIVIWGALFKILHLPGGNALLSLGMGTEVLMFVLTAFDRPPKEYKWEEVFPALKDKSHEPEPTDTVEIPEMEEQTKSGHQNVVTGGGGGSIIVTGSGFINASNLANGAPNQVHGAPVQAESNVQPTRPAVAPPTDAASATQLYIDQITAMVGEMQRLQDTTTALNKVSDTLLKSYEAITQNSAEINESATGYVEQMTNLNKNINGLNTIYEIQLKSVSSQLDAIDRVNRGIKDIRDMFEKSASQSTRYCEETEKMARYMQQLNQVYEKMVSAMSINMNTRPNGL